MLNFANQPTTAQETVKVKRKVRCYMIPINQLRLANSETLSYFNFEIAGLSITFNKNSFTYLVKTYPKTEDQIGKNTVCFIERVGFSGIRYHV
jgi:hypothetical protein